ncbi:hypothetical protein BV25DRAFT_1268586 [Artomyces pyxidatus]|uniref:Uncharacterized protein n=1 Tax=Artomyces pyxidatus TaxID=48021 RepID=A0ACB8TF01_9AGAM|nr:hypothetical protein BV25DRAFT_1268586 [Artomyces pyxidatus]
MHSRLAAPNSQLCLSSYFATPWDSRHLWLLRGNRGVREAMSILRGMRPDKHRSAFCVFLELFIGETSPLSTMSLGYFAIVTLRHFDRHRRPTRGLFFCTN